MGCGCKNKGNTTSQQSQTPTAEEVKKIQLENAKKVNEDVKSAIKKTIEKYYNKGK
jgi:hypothetical protein